MKIKLIVAASENGIIGINNSIPWRLPEEMKHFKETTEGSIVVMGYNTWESLLPYNKSGYLPNRYNIVLSKNIDKRLSEARKYNADVDSPGSLFLEFADSYDRADLEALEYFGWNKDAFIIGGSQVYKYYLDNDLVDEVIYTKIKMKLNGDTKLEGFDNIDKKWLLLSVDSRPYFDIMHYQRLTL
jgi:dihydrofolate reductase